MPIVLPGGSGSNTPWGLGSAGCVFPARTSNQSAPFGPSSTPFAWELGGVPMGGRLRIDPVFDVEAFMASHPTATNAVRVLIEAGKTYGFIAIDWTAGAIEVVGLYDSRFSQNDVDILWTLPASCLQLLDTIAPRLAWSGPTTLAAGTQGTWTLTQDAYSIARDENYGAPVYAQVSTDGGATWGAGPTCSPVNYIANEVGYHQDGPLTVTYTPPAPGSYLLRWTEGSTYFLHPHDWPFTAT